MRKLFCPGIAVLLILALAGCGEDHTTVVAAPNVLEVLSDPTLDGDITQTLPGGPIGAPTTASNTGGVFAGVQVNVAGTPISESRGFLIFPLGRLPANASIRFGSISIFLNNVSTGPTSSVPIPFLLDSIDTVLFPPPIESGDFNSPFRTSRSISFFGTDTGTFVEINVTSLLADAQRALLPDFEVRFVFDEARFLADTTTTRGRIEIDDSPTSPARAPLLHVEYF